MNSQTGQMSSNSDSATIYNIIGDIDHRNRERQFSTLWALEDHSILCKVAHEELLLSPLKQ